MKKKNRLLKYILVLLFIVFITSYIVSKSGYYEYTLQSKKNLTEEEIKQFESDVKEGKSVDITDYLKDKEKDYSSPLSRSTVKVSKKVNDYLKKGIEKAFRILNKLVTEEDY